MRTRNILCTLTAVAAIAALVRGAERQTLTIDSARSRATAAVGKSGILSFAAGHAHQVEAQNGITGTIETDPADPATSRVHVEIDASRLTVSGDGESPDDVPKVQATMDGERVLDVSAYPKIVFDSSNISISPGNPQAEDIVVSGQLTIRNVSHTIRVPVNLHFDTGALIATGHFSIKQTDYGIKPVSVGGVVAVKNELNISFTIVAR